jgi:SAM-dependent methyltransferase
MSNLAGESGGVAERIRRGRAFAGRAGRRAIRLTRRGAIRVLRGKWARFYMPEFQADVERNTRRWDDEWLSYWITEKAYAHKFFENWRNRDFTAAVEEHLPRLSGLTEEEFFSYDPFDYFQFGIWTKGSWTSGATVVELGCGPGVLGRLLSPFCGRYIGIDYSQLALQVARLTSPGKCDYLHLSELGKLRALGDSCDLCVGRYFFIHQNWTNACWILALFRNLLRKGGRVSADFFASGNKEGSHANVWMTFPPESPLQPDYPSCMFEYSDEHIRRLAAESGFSVEKIDYNFKLQRRFAVFVK